MSRILCATKLSPQQVTHFASLGFDWGKALEEVLITALPSAWDQLILALQDLDEGRRAGSSKERLCTALFGVSGAQSATIAAGVPLNDRIKQAKAAFDRAVRSAVGVSVATKLAVAGATVGALWGALRLVKPNLKLGDVPDWWRGKTEAGKICYPTKGEALRAFYNFNMTTIDEWGGLEKSGSKGEFDSVNERYGLTGKKRGKNIAEALWYVMPTGRPFCLDRIDIDALNDTAPGQARPFELPYDVLEAKVMKRPYEDLGRTRRKRRRR